MADYNSSYTGPQIDAGLAKLIPGPLAIADGGTGAGTASEALYAIINALAAVTPAAADYFPLLDASGATAGRVTLPNLALALGVGYGPCATAAATSAKTATISGFVRRTGAVVGVCFSYANTATYPTLNVNGTGAAYIFNCNTNTYITSGEIAAGQTCYFIFDGSYWRLLNPRTKYSGSGTLTVAGWSGSAAPFTQTVSCAGILATDRPTLNDVTGTDMTAGAAIDEAWMLAVGSGVNPQTGAGTITFYASAKPAVAIPFTWEGAR